MQFYRRKKHHHFILALCLISLAVAGCARNEAQPDATSAVPSTPVASVPTTVPQETATPEATPTPSATPTPVPTPTPTAVPLTVSGDPRSAQLATPEIGGRYPCGVVDLFDFPLDPPDAANLSGGRDFGVYRSRYEKYHAGEDWWYGRGNSFGKPVYAIGHGFVTYAEPEGWGRDQGVVIVRHSLADGSEVLSFYGHLDPPSVMLTAGSCVARGEKIGEIGRPRTSPHLHFEMRTQSPWAPLTGYWTSDPTDAGWLPPSQTISEQRIAAAPGVVWTRPYTTTVQPIGSLSADEFAVLQGNALIGVNLMDGSERALLPDAELATALLHPQTAMLITADRFGRIDAYSNDVKNVPLWSAELDVIGTPDLLPLPAGGVLAVWRTEQAAFNADGDLLWQRRDTERPFDWLLNGDTLFWTTLVNGGSVWAVHGAESPALVDSVGGKLAATADALWIYAMDGVFRLRDGADSAELLLDLPTGSLQRGDILALPDGGVLVAHADSYDRRLLNFDADGALRWQRAYAAVVAGDVRLELVDGQPVMIAYTNDGTTGTQHVYTIDQTTAALRHIFSGGSRQPQPGDAWAVPINDVWLLLNTGGGPMALFAPDSAE